MVLTGSMPTRACIPLRRHAYRADAMDPFASVSSDGGQVRPRGEGNACCKQDAASHRAVAWGAAGAAGERMDYRIAVVNTTSTQQLLDLFAVAGNPLLVPYTLLGPYWPSIGA